MASTEDVQKLAALARLSIPEDKLPAFAAEFDAILAYVGKLDELSISLEKTTPALRNVFRADGEPHETGKYTEKIAAQFPARKGDALSVKTIISQD